MIGERIGRYLVKRELARGGMGIVYEAVHEELGQRAAVKVLSQELLNDPNYREFVARFFDEAQAITRIPHPSIVKIFDQGQIQNGTVYILMEFLDGEPLAQRIERFRVRGGMPPLEAVRFARQIASAIAEAHHKAILHRDLKPGNVILVRDADSESGERAKIIDFGIARLMDTPYRRTKAGAVMGTPLYMSPEQCRGEDVDDRADVYAVGTILYEMLSGRRPFDGKGTSVMFSKNMQDAPLLVEYRAGLPSALYQLAKETLQRTRAQRPRMDAVVAKLRQIEAELGKSTGKNEAAQTIMALGSHMDQQQVDVHAPTIMTPVSHNRPASVVPPDQAKSTVVIAAVLLLSVGVATLLGWFILTH